MPQRVGEIRCQEERRRAVHWGLNPEKLLKEFRRTALEIAVSGRHEDIAPFSCSNEFGLV